MEVRSICFYQLIFKLPLGLEKLITGDYRNWRVLLTLTFLVLTFRSHSKVMGVCAQYVRFEVIRITSTYAVILG